MSRRFAIRQGSKVRMIDDFSISGINETCITHCKVDLHMIDTFCAVLKRYFDVLGGGGGSCELVGKTYDLKSAYRQVPIKESHLKYAFFSVYNHELGEPQVYQLLTLPFGATHSVYSFLRLSRMLYSVATRCLFLLTTNFYDDYILASRPALAESSSSSMELVFMLTGWQFAREGKKSTAFSRTCKALGVEFDFHRSEARLASVCNTTARVEELLGLIDAALTSKALTRQESLVLRGKLGFADSYLHGRLGSYVLKLLVEHAYAPGVQLGAQLGMALQFMSRRLRENAPLIVSAGHAANWYLYTDASYEPDTKSGGLGAVLVDNDGKVAKWFGVVLPRDVCLKLRAAYKDTIIYELELAAAVLSFHVWASDIESGMQVWFGDNDAVRHALIRGAGAGGVADVFIQSYLEVEASKNLTTWFARVPTEANISDWPSRNESHPLLLERHNCRDDAVAKWQVLLQLVESKRDGLLGR